MWYVTSSLSSIFAPQLVQKLAPGSSAAPHCGHTRPCAVVFSASACAEVFSASGCSFSGKLEASFMLSASRLIGFLKCLYRSRYL